MDKIQNTHVKQVQGRPGLIWQLIFQMSSSSFSRLVELDIRIQKGVLCDGHIEKEVHLNRNKDVAKFDDLATELSMLSNYSPLWFKTWEFIISSKPILLNSSWSIQVKTQKSHMEHTSQK